MIDWTRIEDLRLEIGNDDFLEVVAMFLEEADAVAAEMLGPSDVTLIEGRLHFLKGSALNLGLRALAEICHAGEKAAALGAPTSVDLQKVVAVYDASKATLLASLDRPDAA